MKLVYVSFLPFQKEMCPTKQGSDLESQWCQRKMNILKEVHSEGGSTQGVAWS